MRYAIFAFDDMYSHVGRHCPDRVSFEGSNEGPSKSLSCNFDGDLIFTTYGLIITT